MSLFHPQVYNGEPVNQQRVHTQRELPPVRDAEFVPDDLSDFIPPSKKASPDADNVSCERTPLYMITSY